MRNNVRREGCIDDRVGNLRRHETNRFGFAGKIKRPPAKVEKNGKQIVLRQGKGTEQRHRRIGKRAL